MNSEFENWASQPPLELLLEVLPGGSVWRGQYSSYHTQLASEAWQAATEAMQAKLDKRDREISELKKELTAFSFSFSYRTAWESEKPRYIPVAESLPAAGKKVLAYYKTKVGADRHICAMYVPDKWLNADDADYDGDCVYDEEKDAYFWPKGWYERIENWDDYSSVFVGEEILSWMELPDGRLG